VSLWTYYLTTKVTGNASSGEGNTSMDAELAET
jgi:hypothetical protein